MINSDLAYTTCLLSLVLLAAPVRAHTERDFNQTLTTVEIAALVTPSVVTITGELGFGSGVVLDSSGVIVTNHHVVEDESYLSIELSNGDIYDDVSVLDVDVRRDLVLLKIKAFNLSPAVLGDSDDIQVGEPVVLVGTPEGYDRTVSEGVVSALRNDPDGYRLIQTSAPISQGSSGGGMFNSSGELIGIAVGADPNGQNLNFAVPINYARGLTSEGVGTTLVEFANQSAETSVDLGSESRVGSVSTAAEDASREKLLAILQDSSHDWVTVEYWSVATVPGRNNLDDNDVWVRILDEEIVYFVSYPEELNIELTPALLKSLLELNYDLNLAKVSIDEDGDVVAHAEVPLGSLDGSGVNLVVSFVSNAADRLKEVVGVNSTPSGAEILGEEFDPESSMDSSAVIRLQERAVQGDVEAQFNLGYMYDTGEGVQEDDVEAARWYRLAADQGDVNAQHNLGLMYDTGEGVQEDDVEAARWYRLAADQGYVNAQYNLGLMYDTGEGVQEDDMEATRWYRLAAEQGNASAQYALGLAYARSKGVQQDAAEAHRWLRLAAEQGHSSAQSSFGWLYANGVGVPEDAVEAARWYRLAADQGDPEGQVRLGLMYLKGNGVPEDYAESHRLFRMAADQGDRRGQAYVGLSYATGAGTSQDYAEGMWWLRLAADQGDSRALYAIGSMYSFGGGVPQDIFKAAIWMNRALTGLVDDVSGFDLNMVRTDLAELNEELTSDEIEQSERFAQRWTETLLQEDYSTLGVNPAIQFNTMGEEFGPWVRRFIAQVKRNWIMPPEAIDLQGQAVFTITVLKNGTVTDVTILEPSSVSEINVAGRQALWRLNPTQPLPEGYPTENTSMTITFYFNKPVPE